VNLAAALAQLERRVLIVDADPGDRARHPLLPGKGDGLLDVLAGLVSLEDAIALTDLPGVSVLGVGDGSSEDVAVLLETRAHGVLARLGTDYDVVLVHTAPLAESEDAVVLAAGNALLVSVPAGVLRPSELRFLAEQLRELPLRLIGCIHIG
jgi:Mrp family chromosome partitioning ATPase